MVNEGLMFPESPKTMCITYHLVTVFRMDQKESTLTNDLVIIARGDIVGDSDRVKSIGGSQVKNGAQILGCKPSDYEHQYKGGKETGYGLASPSTARTTCPPFDTSAGSLAVLLHRSIISPTIPSPTRSVRTK